MSCTCKNCGAQLPEGASFCPHCAQEQGERKMAKPPVLWRKKLKYILGVCCVLLIASIVLHKYHRPRTIEGGAYVTYEDQDGSYELLLGFHPDHIQDRQPVEEKSVQLSPNEMSLDTSMLGIFQNGESVDPQTFFEKVESCSMEALDNENGALSYGEPIYSENFIPAVRMCDVTYRGDSGTHVLVWTLQMKNGDTIRLKHTFEVIPLELAIFTFEETAMDTLEDLNVLLKRIDEEVPADTIVDIYLPPVTYEGGLEILSRAVNLYGSSVDNKKTTFTGTVTIYSDRSANAELYDLHFIGQGGTGLMANASTNMIGCSFTGWDVGAVANDGGYISINSCIFSENGIGLRFNSTDFHSFSEDYYDSSFEGNDIGVQFARMTGNIRINFLGCSFIGNEIDIDNPIDYPVNTEESIFQ